MKQIFLITIAVILVLSGCSNTSSNSNNKNTSVANEKTETTQADKYLITGEIIPASYTRKTIQKDYPLIMRPLSEKAIFKVTMETMVDINNPTNAYPNVLKKLEIIDNDNIVFQKIFNKNYTDDIYTESLGLVLMDFKVFRGKDKDFFAYSLDAITPSAEHSTSYRIIYIIKKNNQCETITLKGVLPMSHKTTINNDRNTIDVTNLYDEKYIKVVFWDGYDAVESEFEFTDTIIKQTQKEFQFFNLSNSNNDKEILKNASFIDLYTDYMLDKKLKSIQLSENSKINILGGKHYNNIIGENDNDDVIIPYLYGSSIHVIIDGEEGWISHQDFRNKLGF